MHKASFLKMKAFRDTYLTGRGAQRLRVLDIGSASHLGQLSYRSLFDSPDFEYIGVDIVSGFNVDVVLSDVNRWSELETASADVVISGQTLEHDPFFWVTMCQISRVLKPGGWCCVVAPSRGPAHFYPRDCWRFYPDSGAALMTYAGMEIVESSIESGSLRGPTGIEWGDMMAIGRLPHLEEPHDSERLQRLESVIDSVPKTPMPEASELSGPAFERYERTEREPFPRWRPYLLRMAWVHLRVRLWNAMSPVWQERITSWRSLR